MHQLLLEVHSRGQFGNNDSSQHTIPFFLLSKFLYVIGHIAIKQMVHLDTSVYKELKRRDTIRKLRKEKDSNEKDSRRSNRKSNAGVTPNSARQMLRNKEVRDMQWAYVHLRFIPFLIFTFR